MTPAARAGAHASSKRLSSRGSIAASERGEGNTLSVGLYSDDHASVRVLTLTATLYLLNVSDGIVNDLSINTIHRLKGDLLTRFDGLLGHLSSEISQSCRSTGTNPTHVHTDLAFSRGAA